MASVIVSVTRLLYFALGATEHDKRSAVATLAGVLEERRKLVQSNLRKGENALFQIANEFALRHRNESHRPGLLLDGNVS